MSVAYGRKCDELAAAEAQVEALSEAHTDAVRKAERWQELALNANGKLAVEKGHLGALAEALERIAEYPLRSFEALQEIASDALSRVSRSEPAPPTYDHTTNTWTPQCPYGDVCSGCDAAGKCSRANSADYAEIREALDGLRECWNGLKDEGVLPPRIKELDSTAWEFYCGGEAILSGVSARLEGRATTLPSQNDETHEPPTYDYVTNTWTPQCPYGDVCSGCDAAGKCSRVPSLLKGRTTCWSCGKKIKPSKKERALCMDCASTSGGWGET